MKELSNVEMFKSLLNLEMEGAYIDLHNDYDCHNVLYDFEEQYLKLFL